MAQISKGQDVVTLINVFTVDPARQQELVDRLIEAIEAVMSNLPGFVSASIHRGLDGSTVTNYAQWRSREAFQAMFQNPDAAKHITEIGSIAASNPQLYEVVYTHGRS